MKFAFDTSGSVSSPQMVRPDGTLVALTTDSHVTYAKQSGFVVETITGTSHDGYEVFADTNGDGVYVAVAHGTGTVDLVGLQTQMTHLAGIAL